MPSATTTLSLVGHSDDEALLALPEVAANIAVETTAAAGVDELQIAWRRAQTRSAIYTMVGFDPLQNLVNRWTDALDSGEPIVPELARIVVPDYYLVNLTLGEPQVSWYLQLLFGLAPQRIITVDNTVDSLYRAVADLPYGPGLPSSRDLEAAAGRFVPTPGLKAALATSL